MDTPMEWMGAACHLAFVAVSCALGLRMAARARATGDAPEAWLAGYLLGAGGFGYGLLLIPAALDPEAREGPLLAVTIAGRVGVDAGMLCALGFTRTVFRPREAWARALCALLVALTVASVAWMFAAGDFFGKDPFHPAFWGELVGAQSGLVWAVVESLRYRARLARRLALGMADPLVVNRLALWAGFGVAQLGFVAAFTASVWIYATHGRILVGLDAAMAGAGLASALFLALAFSPPTAWRRRVTARAARVAARR